MRRKKSFFQLGLFVIVFTLVLMVIQVPQQSVKAQTEPVPFDCPTDYFVFLNDFLGMVGGLQSLDLSTGVMTNLLPVTGTTFINAFDYNVTDDMIWGYDNINQSIIRIDANYVDTWFPNTSTGLPNTNVSGTPPVIYQVAAISPSGEYYITDLSNPVIFIVDVNPNSPTYATLIRTINISAPLNLGDWVFHPFDGYLYGIEQADGVNPHLLRIDPDDGAVTDLGTVTGTITSTGMKNFYAQFMDEAGNLYAVEKSGTPPAIYQIANIAAINPGDTIEATIVVTMSYPGSSGIWDLRYSGDGAHCMTFSTDYGDAPDSYGTTYRSDGAVHAANPNLFLGTSYSIENDAPLALTGTEDTMDDGVTFPEIAASTDPYTASVVVTNNTTESAYMHGWIDFDGDGVFSTNERSNQIIVPTGTSGLTVSLTWSTIPADIIAADTYARVRLFGESTNTSPTGHGGFGEVEDYPITIIEYVAPPEEEEEEEAEEAEEAEELPETGFSPLGVTILGPQPTELVYSNTDIVLEIPSLGVSTTIVGIPQTSKGWNITWLGNRVGYLAGSAFPTWEGNTVLTGHFWNAWNQAGIFSEISDLRFNDQILIRVNGQTYTYQVRYSYLVSPDDVESVFKHEKLDWITLLTCETFDTNLDQYAFRRVVRAVLVSIE